MGSELRKMTTVQAAPYVTLELFATISGYTEKAVRRKLEEGVWVVGREVVKAPDGRILVSLHGFARWAEGKTQHAHSDRRCDR
jgi:hypothetical protein